MYELLISATSVVQVILINIVLSGDNALVVALAARRLPPRQRRLAMFWGVGLAVVLRLALTLIVSSLLVIPGLQLLGALLLAWIACRLLQEEAGPGELAEEAPSNLRKAVARIALADLIMSLDNVLAIAGVSRSDTFQLIFGLTVSIAIILAFSTAIMALMNRFHWIAYLGTAILALTAAGMISHDLAALGWFGVSGSGPREPNTTLDWTFRVGFLAICLSSVRWWPWLKTLRLSNFLPESQRDTQSEPAVEIHANT